MPLGAMASPCGRRLWVLAAMALGHSLCLPHLLDLVFLYVELNPPSKALGSKGPNPFPGGLRHQMWGLQKPGHQGVLGAPREGTKNVLICFFLQDLIPPKSCSHRI